MTQNCTKTITIKNEDDQNFQNNIKKILSMIMYM